MQSFWSVFEFPWQSWWWWRSLIKICNCIFKSWYLASCMSILLIWCCSLGIVQSQNLFLVSVFIFGVGFLFDQIFFLWKILCIWVGEKLVFVFVPNSWMCFKKTCFPHVVIVLLGWPYCFSFWPWGNIVYVCIFLGVNLLFLSISREYFFWGVFLVSGPPFYDEIRVFFLFFSFNQDKYRGGTYQTD